MRKSLEACGRQAEGADQATARNHLLVLGPAALLDEMGPLFDRRAADGWQVTLVDVEDVYDEFWFGQKSVGALRAFFAHALGRWQHPPRAVLLVGDASYDPRDYLGKGTAHLLPTKLVETAHMETASDDWLLDTDGDRSANVPVGRLPARTPAEAAAMAARIARHDARAAAAHAGRTLLVADADGKHDFVGLSRALRDALPRAHEVLDIFRRGMAPETAHERLRHWISQGAGAPGARLLHYFGHGSNDLWAGDVPTSETAETLAAAMNDGAAPVVVAMTCQNGAFHDPLVTSLAEALLRGAPGGGGALAVVAPSGFTSAAAQAPFDRALVRAAFQEGRTLGEALAEAKAAAPDPDVRRTFALFGDPTTTVVAAQRTPTLESPVAAGAAAPPAPPSLGSPPPSRSPLAPDAGGTAAGCAFAFARGRASGFGLLAWSGLAAISSVAITAASRRRPRRARDSGRRR